MTPGSRTLIDTPAAPDLTVTFSRLEQLATSLKAAGAARNALIDTDGATLKAALLIRRRRVGDGATP